MVTGARTASGFEDRGRHVELGEQRSETAIELAGLPDARAVVFVLNDLDAIELVGEVAPRIASADLGDALDERVAIVT
jgi:hypothetical protein